MKDTLQYVLLSLVPKKILSRLIGVAAASKWSKRLIPLYIRIFDIDASLAEKSPEQYESLTTFFTRRLQKSIRPVDMDSSAVVSPVDGTVSQAGTICKGQLIQAKGVSYSADELLGSVTEASRYEGGQFLTIYLSPRDYHRIHAPMTGTITHYTYIPGTLFPVNPFGVRKIKGLFAKNERLVTYLETPAGALAIVKVGATIVGSVRVGYDDAIGTNIPGAKLQTVSAEPMVDIEKGAELGFFEFGSTVILLFEPGMVSLAPAIREQMKLCMGQRIGTITT